MVTASQALERVLAYLVQRLSLTELEGAGRGPWALMAGRGRTRGRLRCFSGPGLDKAVLLTLEDDEQLDAAMLMTFAAARSPVPHLVLDTARVGRDFAVFVDLLPRVDLAVNVPYVRAVYTPLTEVREGLAKHPSLKSSPVPATLLPFVSPWMTGFRLHEDQMPQLFELVAPFVSQWVQLHKAGLRDVGVELSELPARDLRHRDALFSRDADPVWDVLVSLLGDHSAARVLELLRSHGLPPPPSMHPPRAD